MSATEATAERNQRTLSIADRLEHGNLDISEVCALRGRSRSGFYQDVLAGRVRLLKIGRRSVVPGPIARAYIAGQPISA